MALVQYKQGTSTSASFDITLDSPPAANNALILIASTDLDELSAATYQGTPLNVNLDAENDGATFTANILFLTNISAGSSVVHVTRVNPGDTAYALLEVSGLLDSIAADSANASNSSPHNASPSVNITTSAERTFIAGVVVYSAARTLGSFSGDAFDVLRGVGTAAMSHAAATLEVSATGTYTLSATLDGVDDWVAGLVSFALAPEKDMLADLADTSTLPPSVNSFSGVNLERAFRGLDAKFQPRIRAELLDPDLVKLYDLDGLQADGEIRWVNDAAIKGAAQLKFLEIARDSQHSAPLASFSSLITAQNRLFHYRCGEASGNLADFSGNSRTGTANGTITYGIGSLAKGDLLNNAIKLNGTNAFVAQADAAYMDVVTATWITGWSGTGVSQTLIDRDDNGSNRFWRFEVDSVGLLSIAINFTTGSRTTFPAPVKVNDGQPHLFYAVRDPAYVSLYVDGNRVLHTAETRTMLTGTLGIRVGATNAGTNFSSGIFDEVGMLGRALTPKEILDEYQAWSAQTNELLFDRTRNHRVKKYYAVWTPEVGTDGTHWAEYSVGVYLLPTLSRGLDKDEKGIATVQCLDQTTVLNDDKFSARYTVAFGANFVDSILTIAQSAGFNTAGWAVTTNTLAVTADAGIDFEINSSKLEAINYLLQQINYKPIRFNGDGAGVIEPNVLDANIPVSLVLVADGESIILRDGISEEIELRKVPTTVLVATGNPDSTDILGSASVKTGGQIIYGTGVIMVVPADVPDQATADALAQQILNDALAKSARRFKLSMYPRPTFGDRDKMHITVPQLDRDEDFIVEEWTLPLNPKQAMTLSCLSIANV